MNMLDHLMPSVGLLLQCNLEMKFAWPWTLMLIRYEKMMTFEMELLDESADLMGTSQMLGGSLHVSMEEAYLESRNQIELDEIYDLTDFQADTKSSF